MKHILITGAAGYIGSRLVMKLLEGSWEVSVILREGSGAPALSHCLNRLHVYYDGGSIEEMAGFMSTHQVECVVHLATCYVTIHKPADIAPMLESNICFGARLLEAMKQAGVKHIVYARTSWQHYGDESYNPMNLYAAMKQAFEDIMRYYTQAEGFCSLTLEIYDTYGENDPRSKIINVMKRCRLTGETIRLSPGQQKLDYIYIDDVIRGFMTALAALTQQKSAETEYALRSGYIHTLREVVDTFGQVYKTALHVEWGAYPYRAREIFFPYRGLPALDGWKAEYDLYEGFRQMRIKEQEGET